MQTTQPEAPTRHSCTGREQRAAHSDNWIDKAEYNFSHFRAHHLLSDVQATIARRGIPPGAEAPNFTLVRAGGGMLCLSDLRGKPVLLHFGSPT